MADVSMDILVRGRNSLLRVVDPTTKLTNESRIYTKDVFEVISQIISPMSVRKSLLLPASGNNYTALRCFNDLPNSIHLLVEATPRRRVFNAILPNEIELYIEDWPAQMKELVGLAPENSHYCRFRCFIDTPYTVMGLMLRKSNEAGGSFKMKVGCLGFANEPIFNNESPIYSVTFPNLFHHEYSQPPLGLPDICWGTALQSFKSIDLNAANQMVDLFFDAYFNKDLVHLEWFSRFLPHLVRDPNSKFAPFNPEQLCAWQIQGREMARHHGLNNFAYSFKHTVGEVLQRMMSKEGRQ